MSELLNALDQWDRFDFATFSPEQAETIVEAARKVADPDYEAAADAFISEMIRIDPGKTAYGVEMRAIHAAINAALGITDDPT